MAPPAAKNDAAAATQKQLLALVQARGNAETAFHILLSFAATKEKLARSSAMEKATALLRLAVLEREPPRSSTGKPKRDVKKSTKESDKQWALVAAKVAQSVIKLYLGASPPGTAPSSEADKDLDSALDLATLALAIYCQFEGFVKLGDLVLENMLYQIAKKLAEIPKCTGSSLLVFAAIHLRLWHHHTVLCTQLNHPTTKETSPIAKRVDQLLASDGATKNQLSLDDLVDLCAFPSPQSFHTLQFSRFLISVVNVAVNMLLPASKHEAILQVAKIADPWICHFGRIPGVDAKMPASFNDRLFRVLWKCAAAVDAEKPKVASDAAPDTSLEYRAMALSFMLKCPSYSNAYFAQQVHRVGVQFEKKCPATGTTSTDPLCDFYLQSALALFKFRDLKASSMEWDYVHWLEHFVSVCDAQKSVRRDVEALAVIFHSIDHLAVESEQSAHRVIAECFRAIGGCMIVERRLLSVATSAASEKEIRKMVEGHKFLSRMKPSDRDLIVAAFGSTTKKQAASQWVQAATLYLNGLETAREEVRNGLTGWSDAHSNFLLRSIRKLSTRLFNVMISATASPPDISDTILSSLVCAGDLLTSVREAEPAIVSPALKESFAAAEGRVHRLVVTIAANRSVAGTDEESSERIEAMEKSITQFQRVLNEAMTDSSSQKESLPSLIGDLQAIARETYVCATHFYKKNQHEMVVKSLEAAFALAENYLEHVLCDEQMYKNLEQVAAAHRNLKVDAVASLLAFSLQQLGSRTRARQCYGHALLYASDPSAISTNGAIGKYVNAVVEEFETQGESGSEDPAVVVVKSLCESLRLAWKARGLDTLQASSFVQLLSRGFDRFATRTLDRLRTKMESSAEKSVEANVNMCRAIQACCVLETALRQLAWDGDSSLSKPLVVGMVSVLDALGDRRSAFAGYYARRDIDEAVTALHATHTKIAFAIDQLERLRSEGLVDVGGCYGWRGVLALEICQMMRYAAARNEELPGKLQIEESSALDDIKKCLSRWHQITFASSEPPSAVYFNARAAATCLDAVSHALSLMSHTELESQVRNLLCRVKATQVEGPEEADFATSLPSLMLQPEHVSYATIPQQEAETTRGGEFEAAGMLGLQVIDAEIGLCLTSATSSDTDQALVHHSEAVKMMQDFRAVVKISSDNSQLFSAVAMRELALGMAASEIKFQEGDILQAIREAKSALSICWKISKKVGVSENQSNGYELPEAVKTALGKHAEHSQKASQLIYFQAMECWSWDVLLAAKLILSRIASLYALSNQQHRSSIYYAEAMTLVGSVVPATTRNRPFFEFAQLQILAERTSHASAVHQLMTLDVESPAYEPASSSNDLDVSVLTQHCEVRLQRGDLFLLEGDRSEARASYESALQLLEAIERRTPAANSVACGCYRRMVKLHTQASTSEDTIDELLRLLKGLKKAIKKCFDIIEYALGTCQLVQSGLLLLRSALSKAFLPVEKLAEAMDEVFVRCDHLDIPHLRQEIRLTAGHVYLMLSESPSRSPADRRQTARIAANLLSNYNAMRSAVAITPRSIVESLSNIADTALSPTWLVASLTVGESSQLSISLTPGDGSEPVSFWIGNAKWKDCIQELSAIIEASRVTLFGNKGDVAEEWTADKKKTWWNTRKDLDTQLAELVVKMQKTLGFWRALLAHVPSLQSEWTRPVIEDVTALLFKGSTTLTFRSQWLLSAVASSNSLMTEEELLLCVDHIAIEENVRIGSDQARQVVGILRKISPSTSNLDTSTILILHHQLEQFPWEGLDVLRGRAVTRMPSIDLILQNAQKINAKSPVASSTSRNSSSSAFIDPDRVAYLLNPGGDLKTTQTTLEPIFQRGEADRGWRGISGSIPEEETIREYLVGSDLFVYCGHGSGEKYYHRDKIEALRDEQCAAALLFGCSSGRLEREGIFGPHGAVLSYLHAGSPAVLAMLWDVTDKDVDLVSKEILENWLLSPSDGDGSQVALSVALQRARRLCKLQNLNGLAAVCYGLPLVVAKTDPNKSPETKRRRLR